MGYQPDLPPLTTKSSQETFLYFPTGNIKLLDIKTLQTHLQKAESRILSRMLTADNNTATTNWMVDSVIDGFIFKLSDFQNNGCISITAQEALHIFRGGDTLMLFSLESNLEDYHDWSTVNQVLIPFNKEENHWVLVVLKVKEKKILGN